MHPIMKKKYYNRLAANLPNKQIYTITQQAIPQSVLITSRVLHRNSFIPEMAYLYRLV